MLLLFLGGVFMGVSVYLVFCSLFCPFCTSFFSFFSFFPNSAYAIDLFITVVGGFLSRSQQRKTKTTCHVPFLPPNNKQKKAKRAEKN